MGRASPAAQGESPEGKLGTLAKNIFWGGFSGAPDKSLSCEPARPVGQRWLQLRLVADVGGARCPRHPCPTRHGPQSWLVQLLH